MKIIILIWLCLLRTAGFSQSLPFMGHEAKHLQPTNLVVRWRAQRHPWPERLRTYRVVPTKFSTEAISNLMAMGSFTEKDKRDFWPSGKDGVIFEKPFSSLRISFVGGEIEYSSPYKTELAKNVPGTNDLIRLTTNLLQSIGIDASEIARRDDGRLRITWPDPTDSYTFFYPPDHTIISNIQSRMVLVGRALDGVQCRGDGGDARIEFGEQGVVRSLWLYWRSVERERSYSAATPQKIIQWIREGKAFQMHMIASDGRERVIDWPAVKSLTVTNATAYYWGDSFFERERAGKPILPSRVYPYAEISGTVDIGATNIYVEIMCPVIDDTKPLN
jgi:hypothetical protein